MPAAKFVAGRHVALSGGGAQLGHELRSVFLNEGEILWVVLLPRWSRHAGSARADL